MKRHHLHFVLIALLAYTLLLGCTDSAPSVSVVKNIISFDTDVNAMSGHLSYFDGNLLVGAGQLFYRNALGYLGIGVAVPTAQLDVAGDIQTAGQFLGDGSALTGVSKPGDNVSTFANDVPYVSVAGLDNNLLLYVKQSDGNVWYVKVSDLNTLITEGTIVRNGDNISLLNNDSGYITSYTDTNTVTAGWSDFNGHWLRDFVIDVNNSGLMGLRVNQIGSGSARVSLHTIDGGGDPYIGFGIDDANIVSINRSWHMGVDNSDSEAFKISAGDGVGSIPYLGLNRDTGKMVLVLDNNTGFQVRRNATGADTNATIGMRFTTSEGDDQVQIKGIRTNTPGSGATSMIFSTRDASSLVNRMSIDGNGEVGIGVVDATESLQISSATPYLYLKDSSTGAGEKQGIKFGIGAEYARVEAVSGGNTFGSLTFLTKSQAGSAVSERVRIDQNGYVGIGTTTPAQLLDVNSKLLVNGTTGSVEISGNAAGGATKLILSTNNSASPNSAILWRDSTSTTKSAIGSNYNVSDSFGNLEFMTGGTNLRMLVTNAGNVGIGTNAPTQKLDVNGGNILVHDNYKYLMGDASDSSITYDGTNTVFNNEVGSGKAQFNMDVNVNGKNIYTDKNIYGEKVGGGTTNPLAPLHAKVATTNDAEILTLQNTTGWTANKFNQLTWRDATSVAGAIGMDYNAATNTVDFTVNSLYNGTYKTVAQIPFIVKGNGNVGIGTTNPAALLEVSNPSAVATIFQVTNSARNSSLVIDNATLTNKIWSAIDTQGTNSLVLKSGGNTIMSLLNGGNVGIGAIAPTVALDVNGVINSGRATNNGEYRIGGSYVMDATSGTLLSINRGGFTNVGITGNVGLGTNTPSTKLDINGSTYVRQDLNVDGNTALRIPYGTFTSMKTQTVASTSAAYAMDFNTTEDSYMITKIGDTNFRVSDDGDYIVNISIVAISSTAGKKVNVWFRKNGADVPRSNTPYTFKSVNGIAIISVPFIIDLTSSDVFSVMYSADSTDVSLPAYPETTSPPAPSTPSSIMTISKIGESM